MKKTLTIITVILTFCLIGFAQENADDAKGITVAKEIRPADEGRISGETKEYEVYGNNLDYLLKLARPELTLVFGADEKFNIESKKDIRKILDSHWEEALKFYYGNEIKKSPDPETQKNEMLLFSSQTLFANDLLQKETVKAPNGKRNISKGEADGMLDYLNKAAFGVIEKAKNAGGAYTELKVTKKTFASIGNCREDSGETKLRVTFDKSAQISAVKVEQSSGCLEFDENALRAASQIKFEPAKTGEEPITVTKTIVYHFRRN